MLLSTRCPPNLPVQGTDARQTGHFTYVTCPAFLERHPGVPPLRCTNRAEVQAWLAGFGCVTAVEADNVRWVAFRSGLRTGHPAGDLQAWWAGFWLQRGCGCSLPSLSFLRV